jgi:UDP-N-acetylglucosamine 1-carboxyvinyltransferase
MGRAAKQMFPCRRPLAQAGMCSITLQPPAHALRSVDVCAAPYPGFPTDMQPQMTALLATCSGASVLRDTVFEGRMQGHVPMLAAMNAAIQQMNASQIVVLGPLADNAGSCMPERQLQGARVRASDLRAGAALVLAALAAEGESTIENVQQISRGYARMHLKLANVGASIAVHVAGKEVFASSSYSRAAPEWK